MVSRFNPPPGWTPLPEGFVPPPGWQPDPAWPPAPPGWQFWVPQDAAPYASPTSAMMPPPEQPAFAAPEQPVMMAPGPQPMNPPWPVYPSPGSPYMYELPRKEGTNGFAIASFVLGIAGFLAVTALLSVVFGIIALLRIRDAPQRGKGLAIAGLILSSLWIVLGILGIIGAAIGPQPRVAGSASPVPRPTPTNQSTHSTQGRTEDVFLLRPGDCFLNPNTALGVDFVTVIPCTQPHDAQVFALFKATGTSYPGAPALKRQADPGCHARIAGNLDSSKLTDTMNLNFLFPQAQAWLDGHRLITCIIVDSTRDLTSSLRPPGAPTS